MDSQKNIDNLKVGDMVFSFTSEIYNKYCLENNYKFFKIIGETKAYWKVNRINFPYHIELIRKTDLHIRGSIHSFTCMHIFTSEQQGAYDKQYVVSKN